MNRGLGALLLLLPLFTAHGFGVDQQTTGWCSPAVADVEGNVEIHCHGVDPRAQKRLNELLDLKDLQLQDKIAEAEDWARKYRELKRRLAADAPDNKLADQAKTLLKAGELEKAGAMLDRIIADDERGVDQAAANQFNRARIFDLQFEPAKSSHHYAKAYQYRPENPEYAFAYGTNLAEQNQYKSALSILEKALAIYRELAETNPAAYRPYVAGTLNNLANLYSATQRLAPAEQAYQEALAIRRELAETNPAAYRPYVAGTLNNLALLYSATQRLAPAEQAFQEALAIYRELVAHQADAFTPSLAKSLGAWGNFLQQDEATTEAAVGAFAEGIERLTPLLVRSPQAHAPLVVTLARDYLEACEKAQIEPDMRLLSPVIEVLQRLNEAAE